VGPPAISVDYRRWILCSPIRGQGSGGGGPTGEAAWGPASIGRGSGGGGAGGRRSGRGRGWGGPAGSKGSIGGVRGLGWAGRGVPGRRAEGRRAHSGDLGGRLRGTLPRVDFRPPGAWAGGGTAGDLAGRGAAAGMNSRCRARGVPKRFSGSGPIPPRASGPGLKRYRGQREPGGRHTGHPRPRIRLRAAFGSSGRSRTGGRGPPVARGPGRDDSRGRG